MNTLFLLIAEFETSQIPLSQVCEKYLGMDNRKACTEAARRKLPVPAYRCGSQKSSWIIHANDLAEHIEKKREMAKDEWKALRGLR